MPSRSLPHSCLRAALLSAGGLLWLAAAHAQQSSGAQQPPKLPPLFTAATPFRWGDGAHNLGPVRIPLGPGGGWQAASGGGFQVRLLPSTTPDPLFEVILWPGTSGLPDQAERFLLQYPLGAAPSGSRALVLGFHPFGVSEQSVFLGSSLAQLCYERGYFLLAPYGLIDTNFAKADAQTALESSLALAQQFLPFDAARIYAVGFSMGGLSAISYAMRHQDPGALRVAAIVDHTGTLDIEGEYWNGTGELQALLADSAHFGGSPAQQPYAYQRVSPARLVSGSVDPAQARVANLLHVPFYLYANLDDPQSALVQSTQAFAQFLAQRGADCELVTDHKGPAHAWSTLDMAAALDWAEVLRLPADPPNLDEFADRAGAYLYTEVRALPQNAIARYRVDRYAGSNALGISATQQLDELALAPAALGLSTGKTLFLEHWSADGSSDRIVLEGYAHAPSSVTLFGILPVNSWSWTPNGELAIQPLAGGGFAQVVIHP